jgi:hypothetical protein
LASNLSAKGKPQEAIEQLNKVKELDPDYPFLDFTKATLLYVAGGREREGEGGRRGEVEGRRRRERHFLCFTSLLRLCFCMSLEGGRRRRQERGEGKGAENRNFERRYDTG